MAKNNVDFILNHIKNIQKGAEELKKKILEAQDFYDANKNIVKEEKSRSEVTTTDLMDEVQRDKPVLLADLVNDDKLFVLEPSREEFVKAVKNMEMLINHQAKKQNQWFKTCDTLLDDLLIHYIGVLEYSFVREKRPIDLRDFRDLDAASYDNLKKTPNVEIDDLEEKVEKVMTTEMVGDVPFEFEDEVKTYSGTAVISTDFEGIKLEAVTPTDMGFYINDSEINEKSFVYRRLRYNDFEVQKNFGPDALKKLKREKDDAAKVETKDLDPLMKKLAETFGGYSDFMFDEKEQEWLIYVCYYQNPENGRAWRKAICGSVELLSERNKYFEPPFLIGSPITKAHALVGYCAHTLTKEAQKLRTFLYRQISNNLLQANYRRYFGNIEMFDQAGLSDYLNNNVTNSLIRVRGNPREVVAPEEKAPLPPEVFQFAEQINQDKDIHGITGRVFGGTSRQNVNRSYRGQAQQMQAASAKLQLIEKVIVETFLVPLGLRMMNLNTRFLKKETHFRHFNEYVAIDPKNISDQATCTVNIGLGKTSKENQVVEWQQILGLMMQARKGQISCVTDENFYHAARELLNVMGKKDTSNYLTDPKQTQMVMQLLQMLMAFMPQAQQMGIPIPPQIMQMVMQAAQAFHIKPPMPPRQPGPPQEGGSNPGATFPGQNAPPQATQPAQPVTARVTPTGGGHYS